MPHIAIGAQTSYFEAGRELAAESPEHVAPRAMNLEGQPLRESFWLGYEHGLKRGSNKWPPRLERTIP